MKINSSVLIATSVLLLGFFLNKSYLWIPLSVLTTGIIDLFTRQWVNSPRLGSATNFSVLLKFFLALIGFYAMLGQIACIGLIVWWLFLSK